MARPVGGKERAPARSSCKFLSPFYEECYGRGLFHGDGDDHGDVVKSGSEFPRHITSVSERCLASTCRQPCHRGPSPSPSPSPGQSTAVISCHLPLPLVQANFHSSKGMFIVSIEHSRLDLSVIHSSASCFLDGVRADAKLTLAHLTSPWLTSSHRHQHGYPST